MSLNIQPFLRPRAVIEAIQLDVNNLTAAAEWCGGSVKGTKLAPGERVLDLYIGEREERALFGDWIVRYENGTFDIYENDVFKKEFINL